MNPQWGKRVDREGTVADADGAYRLVQCVGLIEIHNYPLDSEILRRLTFRRLSKCTGRTPQGDSSWPPRQQATTALRESPDSAGPEPSALAAPSSLPWQSGWSRCRFSASTCSCDSAAAQPRPSASTT